MAQTRPATSAAPSGATTTFTYDADWDVLTSTDPNGVTTTDSDALRRSPELAQLHCRSADGSLASWQSGVRRAPEHPLPSAR